MDKTIKVLSVGSLGKRGKISPFRLRQGESLRNLGLDVEYFNIRGHGLWGYLKEYPYLRKRVKEKKIDIIHAHYGLTGMLCVLQRKVPVVITFHGSDVWQALTRGIALIAGRLSAWNIFISEALRTEAKGLGDQKYSIIPCGVDLNKFYPMEKAQARSIVNLDRNRRYVLFSASFYNKIKNYPLAGQAMEAIPETTLIELSGYSPEEVNVLMNACDVLLVTSYKESGPLVVKEAMACNLPIVSTKVGDVEQVIGNTKGCYLAEYDPADVADKIKRALTFGKRTDGREKMAEYAVEIIAGRIRDLFSEILDE